MIGLGGGGRADGGSGDDGGGRARPRPATTGRYDLPLTGELRLDARPLVAAVARDVARADPVDVVSARFHDTVAAATAEACAEAASRAGLGTAVLSGGVFLNRRLLEATAAALRARGLRVLVPERLPPGDGGVSYGQAAVASARISRTRT